MAFQGLEAKVRYLDAMGGIKTDESSWLPDL